MSSSGSLFDGEESLLEPLNKESSEDVSKSTNRISTGAPSSQAQSSLLLLAAVAQQLPAAVTIPRRSPRNSGVSQEDNSPTKIKLKEQVMEREKLHEPFGICPCSSFGLDREQQFPHYFFCHHCSVWDIEACANNLSQISSVSRLFKCRARHKLHSLFPTHPKKVHFSLQQNQSKIISGELQQDKSGIDEEGDDGEGSTSDEDQLRDDEECIDYDDVSFASEDTFDSYYPSNKTATKCKYDDISTSCTAEQEVSLRNYVNTTATSSTAVPSLHSKEDSFSPSQMSTPTEQAFSSLQWSLQDQNSSNIKLKRQIEELKKKITQLHKEKSALRSNIAAYNDSSQVRREQTARIPARSSPKECVSAATVLASTIGRFPIEGLHSDNSVQEKLS